MQNCLTFNQNNAICWPNRFGILTSLNHMVIKGHFGKNLLGVKKLRHQTLLPSFLQEFIPMLKMLTKLQSLSCQKYWWNHKMAACLFPQERGEMLPQITPSLSHTLSFVDKRKSLSVLSSSPFFISVIHCLFSH